MVDKYNSEREFFSERLDTIKKRSDIIIRRISSNGIFLICNF